MKRNLKDEHLSYVPNPGDYIYGIKVRDIMDLKNALDMLDLTMSDVQKLLEELSDSHNRRKE